MSCRQMLLLVLQLTSLYNYLYMLPDGGHGHIALKECSLWNIAEALPHSHIYFHIAFLELWLLRYGKFTRHACIRM